MNTLFLSAIIGFDILLVLGMIFILRKQKGTDAALSDLTAEREILSQLQSSMKHTIDNTNSEQKSLLQKLSQMAAEIEQDVASKQAGIGDNLEIITNELASQFEEPLRELTRKQNALATLYKKIRIERNETEQAIKKAGQILKFFDEKIPYDEILSELEDKKYMDARRLLSKGVSASQVSERLGLAVSEVEMMEGISRPNT